MTNGNDSLTRLDKALMGVSVLAIDTAPIIYFIEQHPAYKLLVSEIFQRVDSGAITGISSVITLTEVLTKPLQQGAQQLADEYRNRLLHSRNFTLRSLDEHFAESAAVMRARYRLRTPDAIQVATAIAAQCNAFLANDATFRRVMDIQVLVLDDFR